MVVELDGRQHYDKNGLIEYDEVRTEFLEVAGIKVLRFKNLELEENFDGVCRKIQAEAEQRLK